MAIVECLEMKKRRCCGSMERELIIIIITMVIIMAIIALIKSIVMTKVRMIAREIAFVQNESTAIKQEYQFREAEQIGNFNLCFGFCSMA